jgi:hypothetical protein
MDHGDNMGFFDSIKQGSKKTEWTVNRKKADIELSEEYMRISIPLPSKETIIFYKDISFIELKRTVVEIKTNTGEFKIIPSKVRGGTDKANELYLELLKKMNEKK